jgi:hypothetical protein
MIRSVGLFTPKNRRTSSQMTQVRFPGQPVEDRVRALRQQWADFLVLPLCLLVLTFYEWWRWLFSIPVNPLLHTMVTAVALTQLWRRRRMYRAEMNHLHRDKAPCPTRHLIKLLCSETYRLCPELRDQISKQAVPFVAQWIWHPLKNLCQSSLYGLFLRNVMSACLSGLKKNALPPTR